MTPRDYRPGNVVRWNGHAWIVTRTGQRYVYLVSFNSKTEAKVDSQAGQSLTYLAANSADHVLTLLAETY